MKEENYEKQNSELMRMREKFHYSVIFYFQSSDSLMGILWVILLHNILDNFYTRRVCLLAKLQTHGQDILDHIHCKNIYLTV